MEPKTKVFISYSRKDMTFADRLDATLKSRGFETLIDRTEIYAFEDWWKRIEALISAADTVVFVLSPDAVRSDVAQKEVAFAATLNKRFAPLFYRRVDDGAIPETLRRLNFILFDDESRFDESMARLIEALHTDIEWVRKHTQFGEVARQWADSGRPSGLLLRSPTLEQAERWIATRPHAAPEPTDATQALIFESRKATTRRRNIVTGALSGGLALALLLLGASYGAFYNAQQERNDALIGQSKFLAQSAQAAIADGNATLGLLLALRALPENLAAPDRPFVNEAGEALGNALASQREIAILKPADREVFDFASFSPDGTKLLTSTRHTTTIWDATTGKSLQTLSAAVDIDWGRFSADGSRVFAGDNGDHWYAWESATGRQIFALDGSPRFSPDDQRALVYVRGASSEELRETQGGGLIQTPAGFHPKGLSADGKIVFGQRGSKAQLWNVETGAVIDLSSVHNYYYNEKVRFTPDGTRLILWSDISLNQTGQFTSVVQILDAATGSQIAAIEGPKGGRFPPSVAPKISRLIMAVDDTAYLYDFNSGAAIASIKHDGEITMAAFTSDEKRLITVSPGRVRIGDPISGDEIASLRGPKMEDKPPSAIFSHDGTRLFAAFDAKSTLLVDAQSGTLLARLDGTLRPGGNRRATAGERTVLTGSDDGSARIWDLATGRLSAVLRDNPGKETPFGIETAAFSPDGSRIVTLQINAVRIWNADPIATAVFRGHDGAVFSAAFSPDGTRLATASADKTARIWDVKSHVEIMTLRGHIGDVNSAEFSPDGKLVITASDDKTARIWDAETGKQIRVFEGHESVVLSAAFSPDGQRIVTASADKTARIWDGSSGATITIFRGHEGPVRPATFAPDGKYVLSAGRPYPMIWDSTTGQRVKALQNMHEISNPTVQWANLVASDTQNMIALFKKIELITHAQDLRKGRKATFAAFSPDGEQVVGLPNDFLVEAWDTKSGTPNLLLYFPHMTRIWSANYSKDRRHIVTASEDGATRIWSVSRDWPVGILSAELESNGGTIYSAKFSPDEKTVVNGGADGTARMWSIAFCQDAIDEARRRLPRQLQDVERNQFFLAEPTPSTFTALFATLRRWLAFALPRAGDTCQ